MKAAEMREKTTEQLIKDLAQSEQDLRTLRFKRTYRETNDTTATAKLRRDIARLVTIIREKEAQRLAAASK